MTTSLKQNVKITVEVCLDNIRLFYNLHSYYITSVYYLYYFLVVGEG